MFEIIKRNKLLWLLASVAVVSGAVLVWAWAGDPASATLRFEAAKAAMQVIAVGLFGVVASQITATYQHNRTEFAKRQERQQEAWRRDVENRRDERRRQDDLLAVVLKETLTAYHLVKRSRRLLRAETYDGVTWRITSDVYDRYMIEVNDRQLEFEQLKRRVPFIKYSQLREPDGASLDDVTRAHGDGRLELCFRQIESYFRKVVNEYQAKRILVTADPAGVSLEKLPRLAGFMGDAFPANVSNQIDVVIEILQEIMLQPLALPKPVDGSATTGSLQSPPHSRRPE